MPRTPRDGRGDRRDPRGRQNRDDWRDEGQDWRADGGRGDDWRHEDTELIPRQDRHAADRDRYRDGRGGRGYDRGYEDDGTYADDRYTAYSREVDYSRDRERYAGRGTPPPPRRPDGPGRGGPPPRPPRRRKRYGMRRFMAFLLLLVVGYVVAMLVVASLVWGSITKIDSTPDVADRPSGGSGANYLLVGTDSREELSDAERNEFGTGTAEGTRADTVMLLHVPSGGEPTLVSLPRDSYVEIRDNGWNKLNAAHSIGGAELLVDTVEQNTDLRIDGYLEIGFGGFVGVVNTVGGVRMCLDQAIQDDKAHIDLPAGCQDLTGPEALGYVRMRYSDPRGDIGRVERQREFLSALVSKMSSPATILNPFTLHKVGTGTGKALAMGEDTSMVEGARMALAMRSVANGQGHSVTVPVANTNYPTNVGSTVLWDEAGAAELFGALREGRAITVAP